MKSTIIIGAGALVLSMAGAGAWVLVSGNTSDGGIPWQQPEAVAQGAALYAENCAACHGAALEGAPDWRSPGPDGRLPAPPHDETGHTWHHPDAVLFAITKLGTAAVVGGGYESNMPGFGDILTDDEILATLAYIKSTWPPRVIETHERINAQQ